MTSGKTAKAKPRSTPRRRVIDRAGMLSILPRSLDAPPRLPLWALLAGQSATILAIATVELMTRTLSYDSSIFSLIALIFFMAVVYAALHHGVRHGLLSAAIISLYNAASLLSGIHALALDDRNLRRVLLLLVVLPLIAIVVGRLKERNDYLLAHEKLARKKAEDSEAQLRFMAESMPQKIFTNNPAGEIDYFSHQWIEYTGRSAAQIKKQDWAEIIHPDDVAENVRRWEHSLTTGEPFVFEHRLRRHDGAYRWHLSRAHPMYDDTGAVRMWIGSTTDIHDIKSALEREQKLEKTTARLSEQREELIALNKAKDEFISLASHQLRTPATGVKQYLGMVLEGHAGDLSEMQRDFLAQANESNDRQITIINDLLKVAKVDAGKVTLRKQKTDVVALTQSVIDEQKSKFDTRRQKVVFKPQRKRIVATVDEGHMRMVLENIIDNASKYTPEGKSIEVSITTAKSRVQITVKDNGVGIAADDIKKIFYKFSRIHNPLSVQVGGSGLGLYWAKKIIDLHGGTIRVTSQMSKGSTFIINLHTESTHQRLKPM